MAEPTGNERNLTGLSSTLRCCQLFSGLSPDDLMTIASFSRLRTLDKDETLFREGEVSIGFYLVQSGAVSVYRVNPAGKEQVIHVFRTGESMAEAALASETGYPATAKAVEASAVVVIPKEPILQLISSRPDLAMRMLGSMSTHLRVLVGMLDDLALKDVETRLLNWLVKAANEAGSDVIELRATKRVLAAELGTSSETLSRTLAKLRDEGLIVVEAKTIRVEDLDKLEAKLSRNLS